VKIELKYGNSELKFQLEKNNIVDVLTPSPAEKVKNLKDEIRHSLRHPINTLPLTELIKSKKPKDLVVLLEDKSRVNPDYSQIISELLSELKLAGITKVKFVISYGTHKKQTPEENTKLYGKLYEPIHHDCDDSQNLVSIGRLSTGNELSINRTVAESDFIITMGNIEPHPFAGYTGGRKAILPGVASRDTISRNHAMVVREGTGVCKLENNPIHLEMAEAGKMAGVSFIFNIIRNNKKEIVKIVSGDMTDAFEQGTKLAGKICTVKVREPADVVIISCGGYPKDINLYHAQKSLSLSSGIVKENGTILLAAECSEGFGQPVFEKWLRQYSLSEILDKKESEIEVEGHRAYLTAKILSRCEVVLISGLPEKDIKTLKFTWKKDINGALEYISGKHGNNFKSYIIPDGSFTAPLLTGISGK
jgi:nickel-dependent lactate racemase